MDLDLLDKVLAKNVDHHDDMKNKRKQIFEVIPIE